MYTPSNTPSVSQDASTGSPFSFWRFRNNGIFICDFRCFFEDGSEIAFEGMICSQSGGGMSRGDRKRGHDVFRTSREHADIHAQPKKVKSK